MMDEIALLKYLKKKYGVDPPLPIAAIIIQLQKTLRRRLEPSNIEVTEETFSCWKPGGGKE